MTGGRWFSRSSAHTWYRLSTAPAFGSVAPYTTRPIRALTSAPAHITHGSSVTYSVQSSSRQWPTTCGRVAQRQHLGVRRGVAGELALVVTAGDHHAVAHHDRTDRHVVVVGRGRSLRRARAASTASSGRSTGGERHERRGWDSNPRKVALHTLSKRADSAALAPLPGRSDRVAAAGAGLSLALTVNDTRRVR